MRKSIYILLITIVLFQAGGMLLLLKIQQWHSQHLMAQVIRNPEYTGQKIILTQDEYRSAKINNHELLIGRKMYDIKSVRILGNRVELMVINDSKEEKLIRTIKNLLGQSNRHYPKLPQQLKVFLSLRYLGPANEFTFCISNESGLDFPKEKDRIVFTYIDISTPPPKSA
jgi:hypothetical protein